jgi:hypothetical protein
MHSHYGHYLEFFHELYFFEQLGILNVIEAMEFAPELVYPIYVAACVDWYVIVPLVYLLVNLHSSYLFLCVCMCVFDISTIMCCFMID